MPGGARAWWAGRRRHETHLDPGLQAERTAMAWQRTALGVGAVGALLVHHAGGVNAKAVPGLLGLAAALALLLVVEHRYVVTVRRVRAGHPTSSPALVRGVAATVLLLAVASVVLVALGWL